MHLDAMVTLMVALGLTLPRARRTSEMGPSWGLMHETYEFGSLFLKRIQDEFGRTTNRSVRSTITVVLNLKVLRQTLYAMENGDARAILWILNKYRSDDGVDISRARSTSPSRQRKALVSGTSNGHRSRPACE